MASPFTIDGYVKSYKTFNAGNYQKAIVTISSMRPRKDKEGKSQYDTVSVQCFLHGDPSFEEGSYVVARGEIQGYKDKEGTWQTVNFAESIGVDPSRYKEPKPVEKQTYSPPQNQTSSYSAPKPQTGYSAPQKPQASWRNETPKPVDPNSSEGPELFPDQNIPF